MAAYRSAFAFEVFHLPVEYDVFAEFAFQSSVIQRQLYRWRESYLCEVFITVAYDPGMVSGEYVFELFSYQGIQAVHILYADAFAVGRVRDQHTLSRSLGPLRQRFYFKFNIFGHTGTLDVAFGNRNCF
jgi:hypothetical protein